MRGGSCPPLPILYTLAHLNKITHTHGHYVHIYSHKIGIAYFKSQPGPQSETFLFLLNSNHNNRFRKKAWSAIINRGV